MFEMTFRASYDCGRAHVMDDSYCNCVHSYNNKQREMERIIIDIYINDEYSHHSISQRKLTHKSNTHTTLSNTHDIIVA